jgi:hypothetical protein
MLPVTPSTRVVSSNASHDTLWSVIQANLCGLPCKVAAVNGKPQQPRKQARQLAQGMVSHWTTQLQRGHLGQVAST